ANGVIESTGGNDFVAALREGKHIPRDLGIVLLKALAREPDRRYANVRLLLRDLRQLRAELHLAAGAPMPAQHLRTLFPETSLPEGSAPRLPAGGGDVRRRPTPPSVPPRPKAEAPKAELPGAGDLDVFAALGRDTSKREPVTLLPPPP